MNCTKIALCGSWLLISTLSPAHAQSTWSGAGTDDDYATAANWSPNGVPSSSAATSLFFGAAVAYVVDLETGARTFGSATFDSADDYTFTGTTGSLVGSSATVTQNGSGSIYFNRPFSVTSSAIFKGTGPGGIFFNQGISGTGALTLQTEAPVTIGGNSGLSSSVSVQQGAVVLKSGTMNSISSLIVGSATAQSFAGVDPSTAKFTVDLTADNASTLNASATVSIGNGGTFQLLGNASANSALTLGAFTNSTGLGIIKIVNGDDGATSTRLTFASLQSSAHLFNIDSAGGTLGADTANGARILFSTAPSGSQISAGLLKSSTSANGAGLVIINGNDFAKYDTTVSNGAARGVRAFESGEYATDLNGGTATDVLNLVGGGTLTGARTVNALRLESTGEGQSLQTGAHGLNIGYGILFTGTDDYEIAGTGPISSRTGPINFYVGANTLTLDAPWTAVTSVKAGDGVLEIAGTATLSGAVGFTVADGASEYDEIISGVLTGASAGLNKAGGGTLALVGSTVNDFGSSTPSGVTLGAGRLVLAKTTQTAQNAALGNGSGATFTFQSGTLETRDIAASFQHDITFTGNPGVLMEFAGNAETEFTGEATVGGSRTIVFNNAAGTRFSGSTFTPTVATTGTFILTLAGTGVAFFDTDVRDNGSRLFSLVKQGTSAVYFNGDNSYTGETIHQGGTIGGIGSIASAIVVAAPLEADFVAINPGLSDGSGTLTLEGGLDASNQALEFHFDLGGVGGSSDLLNITGGVFALDETFSYEVYLNDLGLGAVPTGTPITLLSLGGDAIFESGGSTSANFLVASLPSGWNLDLDFGHQGLLLTSGGDLQVQFIPEPGSTALLVFCGGAALLWSAKRSRSRARSLSGV